MAAVYDEVITSGLWAKIRKLPVEERKGFARFRVWEGANIEKRLSDYYAGRKNQFVEEMINPKLGRSDSEKTIPSKNNLPVSNRRIA